MNKVLVVGFGSIGQKHHEILQKNNFIVEIVSKHLDQNKEQNKIFNDINDIQDLRIYSAIFICNETSLHMETYNFIRSRFSGPVLIEKPSFFSKFYLKDNNVHDETYVGYDLRYSSIFDDLKEKMQSIGNIYQVNVHCGQDLATWRNRQYKNSSSVVDKAGGGVINDLSHEIDYLNWIFGNLKYKYVLKNNKKSFLKISTTEYANIILSSGYTNIHISLNYLDPKPIRNFIFYGTKGNIKANFIENYIKINNSKILLDSKSTIEELHKDFFGERKRISKLKDSLSIDKILMEISS